MAFKVKEVLSPAYFVSQSSSHKISILLLMPLTLLLAIISILFISFKDKIVEKLFYISGALYLGAFIFYGFTSESVIDTDKYIVYATLALGALISALVLINFILIVVDKKNEENNLKNISDDTSKDEKRSIYSKLGICRYINYYTKDDSLNKATQDNVTIITNIIDKYKNFNGCSGKIDMIYHLAKQSRYNKGKNVVDDITSLINDLGFSSKLEYNKPNEIKMIEKNINNNTAIRFHYNENDKQNITNSILKKLDNVDGYNIENKINTLISSYDKKIND